MPNAYATLAEYKALAQTEADDAAVKDAAREERLEAASDYADMRTGRRYGPRVDTATGARVARVREERAFTATGLPTLLFYPVDATEDFALYHGASRAEGELVDPDDYVLLYTVDGLSYYGARTRGVGRVWTDGERFTVYATVGTAETPPGIKAAVIELAAIQTLETPKALGVIGVNGFNDPTVEPDAQRITKRYLRSYALRRRVAPNG